MRLRQGAKEIIWLSGNVLTSAQGNLTIAFDSTHSHFFQTKLYDANVALTEQGANCLSLACHLAIPGKELPMQCAFLQKCGLVRLIPHL